MTTPAAALAGPPNLLPAHRAAFATIVLLTLAHSLGSALAPRDSSAPPPTAAQLQLRLNPNHASAAELELLPRIGPTLAAAIVAYRANAAEQPAFRRPEDLDNVYRIGPVTVETLRPFLVFDAADPVPHPSGQDQ